MTQWEEKKVNDYLLREARLKTTSREYLAIKTLLEEGNLLYWFLGKWETLELTKILIRLQFRYEYVTGGIQLRPDSKEDFYYKVINYRAPAVQYNSTLAVGKEERHGEDRMGWSGRRFED